MPRPPNITRRNRRTVLIIALAGLGMLGLAFASVPLYTLFCQVTGYGGTVKISDQPATTTAASPSATPRAMRFNAHVAPGLNWQFTPPSHIPAITPGQAITVHYTATNLGNRPSTGTASFNVTPFKVGPYFAKIECFCFIEQTLAAGESQTMPVTFYLDPGLDDDRNTLEVSEVTLSYTFFPVDKSTQ